MFEHLVIMGYLNACIVTVVVAQYDYGNLASFSGRTYDYADGEFQRLGGSRSGSGDDAGLGFYDQLYGGGDGDDSYEDATLFDDDDASFDEMMEGGVGETSTFTTSTGILTTTEPTTTAAVNEESPQLDRRRPAQSGEGFERNRFGQSPFGQGAFGAFGGFGSIPDSQQFDYDAMFESFSATDAPLMDQQTDANLNEPVKSNNANADFSGRKREPDTVASRSFGDFTSCLKCDGQNEIECKQLNNVQHCEGLEDMCLIQVRTKRNGANRIYSRCMPAAACIDHEAQNFVGLDQRFHQCRAQVAERWVRNSVCSLCHKMGKASGEQLLFNNAAGDVELGNGVDVVSHVAISTILANPSVYLDPNIPATHILTGQTWY